MKGTFTFEYEDRIPNVEPFEKALADQGFKYETYQKETSLQKAVYVDQGFKYETYQKETSLQKAVYVDVIFDGKTRDEVMAGLVKAYNLTVQQRGLTFDKQDLSENVDAVIAFLELFE